MFEETRAMELELYAALSTRDVQETEENTSGTDELGILPLTRELTIELVADSARAT